MQGSLQVEGLALYGAHDIYLTAIQFFAYRPVYTQQLLAFTVEDDLVILSWLPEPQASENAFWGTIPVIRVQA
jgi:hypothetical protein